MLSRGVPAEVRMPLLVLAVVAFAVALTVAWLGALGGPGGIAALVAVAVGVGAFLAGRRRLGCAGRARADRSARVLVTIGGLVALLRHPIAGPDGPAPLHEALLAHLAEVDPAELALWGGAAMAVKFVGVVASAVGWTLALRGQGVRVPFVQTVLTGFLIGRFIGTFLPSTLGLDAWTAWEVGRCTGAWPRVIAAKAAEKVLGATALFAGVLLTLPIAFQVFVQAFGAAQAPWVTAGTGVAAAAVVTAGIGAFAAPQAWAWAARAAAGWLPGGLAGALRGVVAAAVAYRGRYGVLAAVLAFKLAGHVCTATVYWCTARAIGVADAPFLPIVAGSLLQIVGTLASPTIGGEGTREALQALLLTAYYDADPARAVLAASLGFVAAEAATFWGGAFLWTRTPAWRPRFATVDGRPVAPASGPVSLASIRDALARSASELEHPPGVEAGADGEGPPDRRGLGDAALEHEEVAVERDVEAP
jgi:hypothetical protein